MARRALARVSDSEAFLRPLGGYFRDRFDSMDPAPERLRVLFVSPYPICPPVHGGGVFMYQTLRELAKTRGSARGGVAGLCLAGRGQPELRQFCASAEWIVHRGEGPRA